jgi:hypothetical protein
LTGEYEDLSFDFGWILVRICVGFHGFFTSRF